MSNSLFLDQEVKEFVVLAFNDEMRAFVLKILVPALVALSIKIAIMNQQKKVSIFQVITSFVTGIGAAYLFSDWVMDTFEQHYVPLVIATITISGEKIGYYVVYRMNIETLVDVFISKFKKS